MEILKDKETEVFNFLDEKLKAGNGWVVYQSDSLIENPSQLHCFTNEFDASQYEHDFTTAFDKMAKEPISGALESIQWQSFEQSLMSFDKPIDEENIKAVLNELAGIGFDPLELENSVRRFAKQIFIEDPISTTKKLGGNEFKFHIGLQEEDGYKISFTHYDAVIRPPLANITHGVFNRVDTSKLEEDMGKVNWKNHPGNFFYSPEDQKNPEVREMWYLQKQLDRLIDHKWKGTEEEKKNSFEIWESLVVKFFSNTPLELALTSTVPYLRASFEQLIPFNKEVKVEEAIHSLQSIINNQNNNLMNSQNLEFLQTNLKYFGFGDKLNDDLKKNIEEQKAEFQLKIEIPHFNNKMDFTLHFKKSDTSEMYFFNRYDAGLKNGKPENDKQQSFYVNKGSGITAKEAFNLLEGRSVYKDLINREGEKYSAWVKLDFENKDNKGNHVLKHFGEKYGYDLEKSLANYPIKELSDPEQKKQLFNSLQKGNVQQVSMNNEGKEGKFFIEALPQFKNINVYDSKMHLLKRQNLQTQKPGKVESVSQDSIKKPVQKKDSEEQPAKQKQARKRKMSI